MRANELARKIRIKAAKKLLVSIVLLLFGADIVYGIVAFPDIPIQTGFSCLFAGAALIAGLALLFRNLPAALDANRSAEVRKQPYSVSLQDIVEEYQAVPPENRYKITGTLYYRNRFSLAKDWLIAESFWSLRFIRTADLLWAFLKTEGASLPSTAVISTSKTMLVLRTADSSRSYTGDETSINGLLHGISKAYPWVLTDNTKALENLWRDDRDTLIRKVNEKKKEAGYLDIR